MHQQKKLNEARNGSWKKIILGCRTEVDVTLNQLEKVNRIRNNLEKPLGCKLMINLILSKQKELDK